MEEYLSAIPNRIGDPIFVKDNDHRLLMVNQAFCEMFSMREEEVIGKTLAEHVPEDEREHFLRVDRAVLETGKVSEEEETLTLDGSPARYIITKKYRFIDSLGRKYLIGIIHDISTRRDAEKLLEQQHQDLQEMNERKDKILSVLSHDLRAPINSIIGLAGIIQLESEILDANPTCQRSLQQITEAAYVARDLLENLLEWAVESRKADRLKLHQVDVDLVLKQVVRCLIPSADMKHISLEYAASKLPLITSNERALAIVLRNLVQNAIKFTENGGRVAVRVNEHHDHLTFEVNDTGVGIKPEIIDRLLDSTINASTPGTSHEKGAGLGIALCNEFVVALGGELSIESSLGKGSTFSFTLPK